MITTSPDRPDPIEDQAWQEQDTPGDDLREAMRKLYAQFNSGVEAMSKALAGFSWQTHAATGSLDRFAKAAASAGTHTFSRSRDRDLPFQNKNTGNPFPSGPRKPMQPFRRSNYVLTR